MAVVTVQVGQCGNQLGTALFNALTTEAEAGPDDFGAATRQACSCDTRSRLLAAPDAPCRPSSGQGMALTPPAQFWSTWSPRCASRCAVAGAPSGFGHADASRASQVVAAAVRGTPQRGWAFDERAALTFESGSGNNWARGYNTYGPKFRSRACELLRREARAGRSCCRPGRVG